MRKLMAVLALVMCVAATAGAQGLKVVGMGYSPLDGSEDNPFGVGAMTWSNDEFDFEPGIYGQVAMVSWDDRVRLNLGVGFIWNQNHDRPEARPLTSATFGIPVSGDLMLEVGAYYAAMWGLDERSDDPWGFMLGLVF